MKRSAQAKVHTVAPKRQRKMLTITDKGAYGGPQKAEENANHHTKC